jgi:holo-[acyl-carrier protein] synthase
LRVSQLSFGRNLPESVIGVGVDIIRTARFEDIALRAPGGVAARLFTANELADRRANDCEYLASRFAAKEAVMKSLGCGMGDMSFEDIEVYHLESGAPAVRLSGVASRRARQAGAVRVLVSVSHDRDYVCAFAVALGSAGGGGADDETCDS